MGNGEELSQSVEALEMAKLRLENMAKEAEMLQMSLNEHVRAIETLKAMIGAGEGKEILVPIGAGTFIPARTAGSDWALVGIGTGVTMEKKLDEAIAALEKEAAEVELGERRLIQEMKNLEKQANFLSQRVQAMSQGEAPEREEAPKPQVPKRAGRKKDEEE